MVGLNEAEEAFGAPPASQYKEMNALGCRMLAAERMDDPLPSLRECIDRLAVIQGDAYDAALSAGLDDIAAHFTGPDPIASLTGFFHAARLVGETAAHIRMLEFGAEIVAARQEAKGSA